ncbi:RDD domain containing protein (fragment) [Candidatus Sulfopaludibacter sp. SbA3]
MGFAIQAATERDTYAPLARIELFADLAAYFRGLVQFPPAALEGLTDEQYVRSVLRVVMGRSGVGS